MGHVSSQKDKRTKEMRRLTSSQIKGRPVPGIREQDEPIFRHNQSHLQLCFIFFIFQAPSGLFFHYRFLST